MAVLIATWVKRTGKREVLGSVGRPRGSEREPLRGATPFFKRRQSI
jgi:hypothetical protein